MAKLRRRPLHSKDTPIKHKNSLMRVLCKRIDVYGPLLELNELEESKVPPAQGSLVDKGLDCSLSHPTSTLAKNNDRDAPPAPPPAPPPMPSPTNPMTPAPTNTFGSFGHFETPGDDPTVPKAALETVSGLEYDTTVSYEGSDDSCSLAASTSCTSSPPSPEVFRSGCDRVTPGVLALRSPVFSTEEEPLDLSSQVKNSTLLDVSHAKNIHMQQFLDLSTIKGTSSYSPVRENQSSESKGAIVESKRRSNRFVSDWNFKKISPKAGLPTGATPVQRQKKKKKKKVRFASPVSYIITIPPGAVQTCSSPGSRGTGEPDRPVRLFHFADGRDSFFRRLRERDRCARLLVPSFLRTHEVPEVPSRGVTC